MAEGSDTAIGWTTEARDDRTVVVTHTAGHRLVYGFRDADRGVLDEHSVHWATDRAHAADRRAAYAAARIAARTEGWG